VANFSKIIIFLNCKRHTTTLHDFFVSTYGPNFGTKIAAGFPLQKRNVS